MLIFKNKTLKIVFKNKKFFVFLLNQLFFVQPILFFKEVTNWFFYWFFYVLKNLHSFGLFSTTKQFLKKINIK